MSRLGKTPIKLPKDVEVKVKDRDVEIKGPKGTLSNTVPEGINVVVDGDTVTVNFVEGILSDLNSLEDFFYKKKEFIENLEKKE